jgi:hypothetical protein
MTDFSFRGINIAEYGFHYAPEYKDWDIWSSDYKVFEKDADSQNGSHWYSSKTEAKEFELRCYFEEITEAMLSAGLALFKKDAVGELIFDERPWLAYTARTVERNVIEKYPSSNGRYSGLITLSLKAYYPFAVTDMETLEDATEYNDKHDAILATTGLVPSNSLPTSTPVTALAP